jgi:hypothetical protein
MEHGIGLSGPWWAPLRFRRPEAPPAHAAQPRCPSCWSRDCVQGIPHARFDRAFLRLHRVPYECRRCGRRFRLFQRDQAARILEALDREIEQLIAGRR